MRDTTIRVDDSTWNALLEIEALLPLLREGESVRFSVEDNQLRVTAVNRRTTASFLVRPDDAESSESLLARAVKLSLRHVRG